MPRDVEVFKFEIENAIETIQKQGKTIIPRRLIEEEVENNREKYPRLGKLENIPLKMAISASVNKRPDAIIYGKRPVSWSFVLNPYRAGVVV
jgi:hypothetical protein